MIGEVISDKYKIVAPLSESHMYEVFKAHEIATGATVVIKLLKEEMAVNTDRVKCFSDEIRSFASVSHPLVAAILDIDMYDDRPYVVTELVDGEDLHSWIKGEVLPFAEAIKIMQDLATVLQYAADEKVEYRTIKLSNVLRNREGKLKVLSFTHPRLKLAGRKRNSENSGVHSDLFFLGTTFFELLAGESPIRKRGGINELWDMKLESLLRIRHSALTPEQIDKVVAFIRRTLTREMNNRFESHEEFLKSIADLAGLVRGNSIKQKGRQLSMASQVVDALNGRMSNINTAMPKILPRSTATELQAATGSLADQTGEVLEPGVAQAFEGNLALDSSLETIESSANDEMPSFKAARRPALKLLKNSVPASDNQAWQEAEEAHWLRNPVIFMGSCLVVMILLILFW
jgi:serine/threonine protein kinase